VRDLKEVLSQKQLSHTDYWQLYDSLITAQSEKKLLQQQNNKLIKLAKRLKNKTNNLRNAVKPETRIIRPTAELEEARRTIKILQQSLQHTLSRQQRLQHILLHQEKYAIAKKMRNLGFDEFKRISRILGFKQGDILFVEDPNTVSERTLNELKENIELIIAVRQTKPKVAEQIPFTILDASSISHTQDEYFAFLDKKSFEKARSDKALLRKLIEDYQAERKGI
jgi:predicted RNase H-like nuclease (RuvC/YqgF family)